MSAWIVKASGVSLAIVLTASGAAAATPAKGKPAQKPRPCAGAQALLHAGRADAAQHAYSKLLAQSSVPKCAVYGLQRVRRLEISTAGALIHAGYRKEAMAEIQKARLAAPTAPLPPELRRFIHAQRVFDEVRALEKGGLSGAAEDKLRAFVYGGRYSADHPPAGGIPPDMRPLLDEEKHPDLGRFHAWVSGEWQSEVLHWFFRVLFWLLVAALGTWIVVTEWRRRRRREFSIAPFAGVSSSADDDDSLAKGFGLELQERYDNLGVQMGGGRIDLTLPPPPQGEFPTAVTDAIPQMKYVAAFVALLDRYVPSRGRELSGYLQPATDLGVGASLALSEDNRKITKQVTLRQREYGPASTGTNDDARAYAALLTPAAYWLLEAVEGRDGRPRWEASALFAAGAQWQEAGDPSEARRLYAAALRYEPPIPGVLLNLGALEIKDGAGANPVDVDEILRGIDHVLQAIS